MTPDLFLLSLQRTVRRLLAGREPHGPGEDLDLLRTVLAETYRPKEPAQ